MRLKHILVMVTVSVALAGSAFGDEKKAPAAKAKASGKAVLWAADDLKWIDPPNSPPGVKMAVLWGDPQKGPHGAFHKFVAGFDAPLHHHTPDYRAVVISGTLTITPEGGAPKKLPAGSYGSFSGMKKHTTKCDAGADCIIMVDAKGAWDVVLDEAKK